MNCVLSNHSPLLKAVKGRNMDLIEFLVFNGADVNQRIPYCNGGTVLHFVCWVIVVFVVVVVRLFQSLCFYFDFNFLCLKFHKLFEGG